VLVEEINVRFKLASNKHPVEEFKRLHQSETVGEYIKKLGRVKTKLLYYDKHLNEDFFIRGFYSDLKEKMRYLIEVLQLRKLNDTFNYACKIELSNKGRHEIQRLY
jgi:division protein CdvB (Snf7/Vps24/ESCRT-III family)